MTTTATRPGTGRARAAIAAKTLRTDRWWFPPLVTFAGLTAWVVYATVRVFMHKYFYVEDFHYLTPFYSPCLTDRCGDAAEFGTPLPTFWLIPEAAFTLPFLLLFRLTCYYYRKAYYRAFWLSPPACAVPDGHRKYTGESRFPLLIQNIHRYFFYIAALFGVLLTYDLGRSFEIDGRFFIGVGTAVLAINVALIWIYTLSCHSCRHIIGGQLKSFSKHPMRYRYWKFVSKLNARHMLLAWLSLIWIGVADLYIWLVSNGTITDYHWIS
jgi:hypothetical protein